MEKEEQILEIVHWWEKLRVIYNLFLLFAFIMLAVMMGESTLIHWEKVIFLMLYWFFGANVFYTMSWASEILIIKYLGRGVLQNTST